MMFYIVIVWLELFAKLELVSANKWFYLMTIGKAVIVAQIAAVITPEDKDIDHKEYFFTVRRTVFLLISVLILVNFALQEFFYNDERPLIIRGILILATVSNAIWDKVWLRVIGAAVIFGILVNILIGL
jgi:biotin transporter BioY